MSPSPDAVEPADWQVEPPRPADRGLVGRLLESVVAADPSVAPEVADGSVRAGAWLHRERPAWAGVVVDPTRSPRTVVGYVDVAAVGGAGAAHATRHLLVDPAYRGRGVDAALTSAAAASAAELAGVVPVDDGLPDADEVTFEPERVTPSRWRTAAAGAALIAGAGALGVVAVQVGAGPLGSFLPFLAPGDPASSPGADPDPEAGPASPPAPQTVVPAGAPLAPQPAGNSGTDPSAGPTSPPTNPPSTPPGPPGPPPPSNDSGLVSLLLDPVVAGVIGTADGLTGDALAPVTGTVQDTTDATTDVLDGVVDGLVGLLPAPGTMGP